MSGEAKQPNMSAPWRIAIYVYNAGCFAPNPSCHISSYIISILESVAPTPCSL